jgi:superfamily II DNA or RNA helicase
MLRDYQTKAINEIRTSFAGGENKVLLHLATGAGKTVIFCDILKKAYLKQKRAIIVVRGRELVDQASVRLFRESVPHGVLMANHWNYRPHERIQVCSIDTLIARKLFPSADLVVVDEAHLFTSSKSVDYFSHYKNSFILSVTATPYTDKSLEHLSKKVVHPITMRELIAQGYLVPARYYAPSIPDLSSVHTRAGDFVKNELQNVMSDATLVGDLVSHWKQFASDRPSLAFGVSIKHSKQIVEAFNEQGIKAEHHDADSTDKERKSAVKRLEKREIKVISNVGIFCTGVDIPNVSCLVFARPTKSYNLYIQQAGRGTRIARGKSDFIILDHAGNCLRHGFIEDEKEAQIKTKEKKVYEKSVSPSVCKECFAVFKGSTCPSCGQVKRIEGGRKFEVIDGNLKEITKDAEIINFIKEKRKLAKEKGYRRGWVYWRLVDKFGEEVANKFMPKPKLPDWVRRKYAKAY